MLPRLRAWAAPRGGAASGARARALLRGVRARAPPAFRRPWSGVVCSPRGGLRRIVIITPPVPPMRGGTPARWCVHCAGGWCSPRLRVPAPALPRGGGHPRRRCSVVWGGLPSPARWCVHCAGCGAFAAPGLRSGATGAGAFLLRGGLVGAAGHPNRILLRSLCALCLVRLGGAPPRPPRCIQGRVRKHSDPEKPPPDHYKQQTRTLFWCSRQQLSIQYRRGGVHCNKKMQTAPPPFGLSRKTPQPTRHQQTGNLPAAGGGGERAF